ncbi:hypothetical protein FB451DRAFT_208351 [Mycena latifolia]|nr:hypothetical protein FB451DRAFT_208351 [Mycena latifolia]
MKRTREAIFLELDLGNIVRVKRAADEYLGKERELHIIFNHGGQMLPPVEHITDDGYDARRFCSSSYKGRKQQLGQVEVTCVMALRSKPANLICMQYSWETKDYNAQFLIPWARLCEANLLADDKKNGEDLWEWLEEQIRDSYPTRTVKAKL